MENEIDEPLEQHIHHLNHDHNYPYNKPYLIDDDDDNE
jgi:hypothetical protein